MSRTTLRNRIYYTVRPLIPRRAQVWLRSQLVRRTRKANHESWPILESAGGTPAGWQGWPQGRQFAVVLAHDVETAVGHQRVPQLLAIEQELGFRSSFNFVPERYPVDPSLRATLVAEGFEVGVHGLTHDGKLFDSYEIFQSRAVRINHYLADWQAVGFVSPSSHHNLDWMHLLNIEYDSSTFDTDPFEPQPDSLGTIFPVWVADPAAVPATNDAKANSGDQLKAKLAREKPAREKPAREKHRGGFVELPYTLAQDYTLFILMGEASIELWQRKVRWIAEKGGMVFLIAHPDYMHFGAGRAAFQEYPVALYREFLEHLLRDYAGAYWHALPRETAQYYRSSLAQAQPAAPLPA